MESGASTVGRRAPGKAWQIFLECHRVREDHSYLKTNILWSIKSKSPTDKMKQGVKELSVPAEDPFHLFQRRAREALVQKKLETQPEL